MKCSDSTAKYRVYQVLLPLAVRRATMTEILYMEASRNLL